MRQNHEASETGACPARALLPDSWTTTGAVIGSGVPAFERWESERYRAEYFFRDGDLIVHFYPPDQGPRAGFRHRIGDALEATAPGYFKAGRPRLEAAYTPELESYWLRASGAGHGADPDALACRYFRELDRALDGALTPLPCGAS